MASMYLCPGLVPHLCLPFCNSIDCSLPTSSVHGILQARKLEWVAIPFKVKVVVVSDSLQPHGL